MKKLVIIGMLLGIVSLTGSSAFALFYSHRNYYGEEWTCAPEVQQRNIETVDKILLDFSKTDKASSTFRSWHSDVMQLSGEPRVNSYYTVLGINSTTEKAKFLGQIEINTDSVYVQNAMANLDIKDDAAMELVQRIQKDLKGDLR